MSLISFYNNESLRVICDYLYRGVVRCLQEHNILPNTNSHSPEKTVITHLHTAPLLVLQRICQTSVVSI